MVDQFDNGVPAVNVSVSCSHPGVTVRNPSGYTDVHGRYGAELLLQGVYGGFDVVFSCPDYGLTATGTYWNNVFWPITTPNPRQVGTHHVVWDRIVQPGEVEDMLVFYVLCSDGTPMTDGRVNIKSKDDKRFRPLGNDLSFVEFTLNASAFTGDGLFILYVPKSHITLVLDISSTSVGGIADRTLLLLEEV